MPIWSPHVLLATVLASTACATAQDRLFPPDAVVNVTLPPYSAKPDDGQDDTAAIQKAVTANLDTGRTLYFPAGVYDIGDTIVAKNKDGLWRAHLTYQGLSREKTIFRLKDNAAGFGDAKNPKAMIMTGSNWNEGDGLDGGGNKAFRNNVFDLSIDVGTGNAGAVGIEWAVSNQGSIKDVTIISPNRDGAAGIAMRRRIPGPGFIKNVLISGFDAGIDIGDGQYGVTLEHVSLKGQRVAGIRIHDNLIHARDVRSENSVPAIVVTGANGVVTIVDSYVTGGAPDALAIDSIGSVLARNVTVGGYRLSAIRNRKDEVSGHHIDEFVSPPAQGEPATNGKNLLAIEETPDYWNADLADWVAVGPRRDGEPDDTAAMQRAMDAGKSTVYFVNDRIYFLSDTVVIRGKVKQVIGFGAEVNLGAAKEPFSDVNNPRPLFRIGRTEHDQLFLENMFFNAQYPGELLIENNGPADVIMKHSAGWVGSGGYVRSYRNTPAGTGKVFLEDVFLSGWQFNKQTVFARQFNPENWEGDGTRPQVENHGGKLWILGFKTEGPGPFIVTTAGGATELLGAYNYVNATKIERFLPETVPYVITDATANLSFTAENFRDADYVAYVQQTTNGNVTNVKPADLSPRNGNPGDRSKVVTLYRSQR